MSTANAAAAQQLANRAASGSPLDSLLQQFEFQEAQELLNILMADLAAGLHPSQMARDISGILDGGFGSATTIARTETLGSWNDAALENYRANSDVVGSWMWMCEPGAGTCVSCLEEDGTIYGLDEELDDHPNGRCCKMPVTNDYGDILSEYGIDTSDMEWDAAPWEDRETGARWLERQGAATQRQAFGSNAAFNAWKSGDVALKDFVGIKQDATWGDSIYQKSLRSMGLDAKDYSAGSLAERAAQEAERAAQEAEAQAAAAHEAELVRSKAALDEAKARWESVRGNLPEHPLYFADNGKPGAVPTKYREAFPEYAEQRIALLKLWEAQGLHDAAWGVEAEEETVAEQALREVAATVQSASAPVFGTVADMQAREQELSSLIQVKHADIAYREHVQVPLAERLMENPAFADLWKALGPGLLGTDQPWVEAELQDAMARYGITHEQAQARYAVDRLIGAYHGDDVQMIRDAFQEAARAEFGSTTADMSFGQERLQAAMAQFGDAMPALQSFLRDMYDNTQQWLADHDITEVQVFRGVGWKEGMQPSSLSFAGGEQAMSFGMNPISSFSASSDYALKFVTDYVNQNYDYYAVVADMVPANQILSTISTGFGDFHSDEVVLLGGSRDMAAYSWTREAGEVTNKQMLEAFSDSRRTVDAAARSAEQEGFAIREPKPLDDQRAALVAQRDTAQDKLATLSQKWASLVLKQAEFDPEEEAAKVAAFEDKIRKVEQQQAKVLKTLDTLDQKVAAVDGKITGVVKVAEEQAAAQRVITDERFASATAKWQQTDAEYKAILEHRVTSDAENRAYVRAKGRYEALKARYEAQQAEHGALPTTKRVPREPVPPGPQRVVTDEQFARATAKFQETDAAYKAILERRVTSDAENRQYVNAKGRYEGLQRRYEAQQVDAAVAKIAEEQAARELATGAEPLVSPEWVKQTEAAQEPYIAHFAAEHGMTPDQYRAAVTQHLNDLVAGAKMETRVAPGTLTKILNNGRFRSQVETDKVFGDAAVFDPEARAAFEKAVFDINKGDAPLVFGYLSRDPALDAPGTMVYGDAIVELKPDVNVRSTVTFGDSNDFTNGGEHVDIAPAPLDNLTASAWNYAASGDALALTDLHAFDSYVEAQIHGGVQASDIAKVTFTPDYKPSAALKAKLDAAGISYERMTVAQFDAGSVEYRELSKGFDWREGLKTYNLAPTETREFKPLDDLALREGEGAAGHADGDALSARIDSIPADASVAGMQDWLKQQIPGLNAPQLGMPGRVELTALDTQTARLVANAAGNLIPELPEVANNLWRIEASNTYTEALAMVPRDGLSLIINTDGGFADLAGLAERTPGYAAQGWWVAQTPEQIIGHEVGHLVQLNYKIDNATWVDAMDRVAAAGGNPLVSQYAGNKIEESFAETFALVVYGTPTAEQLPIAREMAALLRENGIEYNTLRTAVGESPLDLGALPQAGEVRASLAETKALDDLAIREPGTPLPDYVEQRTTKAVSEYLTEQLPDVQVALGSMDVGLANAVGGELTRLGQLYPEVLDRLEIVAQDNTAAYRAWGGTRLDKGAYAGSAVMSGSNMEFSQRYWRDPEVLRTMLSNDEARGWLLPGASDPAQVVTHEFGHLVEAWVKSIDPDGNQIGYMSWRRFTIEHADEAATLSQYATIDNHEFLAEAFAAAYSGDPALEQLPVVVAYKAWLDEMVAVARSTTP